ncbi:hypothetical protein [Mycobacterium scrofulaceum]|nr:hypothetical protein [Mycobacterium scrofulaceum]
MVNTLRIAPSMVSYVTLLAYASARTVIQRLPFGDRVAEAMSGEFV